VLAEGTRGALSQAYLEWQKIGSDNPQLFAMSAFGGSFMYPLEPNLVALGIVVGLDYREVQLDVHVLLQRLKEHPLFRRTLQGGEMVEWGAKTIPEGGFYSIPQRLHGDGIIIVGDAAGFVEVASLKGVHYAMHSGMLAARAIFNALKTGETTSLALQPYDEMVDRSYIARDLRERRNMRLAFHRHGFIVGGIKAGLMTLTRGAFPGKRIAVERDAAVRRTLDPVAPFKPDGALTFAKLDAVFKSGNATRDTVPSHLVVGKDIPPDVAEFYEHLCPAGVYERSGDTLVVNAPNCVDCKATDVVGPRWTPREGGSGPRYTRM
jgi:electron-transferring-flavoprotein dehydrogenase